MHEYPPAPPYPTLTPQKRRGGCMKIVAYVIAAFFGLAVFVSCMNDRDSETTFTDSLSTQAPEASTKPRKARKADDTPKAEVEASLPGIGDVVHDGKFAFKVTKVEKGLSGVGSGFARQEAQGQYVIIHVTVKNVGDKAQLFTSGNQKLYDNKGREFEADTGAALFLDGSNSFLEEINPGNTVRGKLLYDVPKGAKLDVIELHDSILSNGVRVSLK